MVLLLCRSPLAAIKVLEIFLPTRTNALNIIVYTVKKLLEKLPKKKFFEIFIAKEMLYFYLKYYIFTFLHKIKHNAAA